MGAMAVLRDSAPQILQHRRLAQRLVKVTGDSIRLQPPVIIARVAEKIGKLGSSTDAGAARREFEALLDRERARWQEEFQIRAPSPAR